MSSTDKPLSNDMTGTEHPAPKPSKEGLAAGVEVISQYAKAGGISIETIGFIFDRAYDTAEKRKQKERWAVERAIRIVGDAITDLASGRNDALWKCLGVATSDQKREATGGLRLLLTSYQEHLTALDAPNTEGSRKLSAS